MTNKEDNYFSDIEHRFQQRRRSASSLSAKDWRLIEIWKEAGIPLVAVLNGIDQTFDNFERTKSPSQRINSLAYCAQQVLAETERMKEANVGKGPF